MQFPKRFRQCLAEGRVAGGIFLNLNSPESAELLAHHCDLDWVGTDLQHAPMSPDGSTHLLRAVQAADPSVTPFVRMPDSSTFWVQQSLDAGYIGLIVPQVESAEQIRRVVQAAQFPPLGQRSFAGTIRAALYEDYMDCINDELIVLPQIESPGGLEHVDQIIAEPGVSGVLLGPADLSLSCGWETSAQQWQSGPFLDAVRRVLEACRRHEKWPTILVGSDLDVDGAQREGFVAIGIGGDRPGIRTMMVELFNKRLRRLNHA